MFAIIETLGRQYKVKSGDLIKVDRMSTQAEGEAKADLAEGTQITFNRVLLVSTGESVTVGSPLLNGALVSGTVVETGKEKKGLAFKKKRRKGYTRKVGFRRAYTVVQIDAIKAA